MQQSSHQAAAENGSGNEETMGAAEGETAASAASGELVGATDKQRSRAVGLKLIS